MKVKDLIEKLREHGEDKDVYILYDQFGRMEPDQMVVVDSEELAEREYWRKLRGDILLALINKSTSIDLSLPDRASDLTERLYRQDKDFFDNLDKD